ncbi:MAG: hypothetical protein JSV95_04770 [Gemmatimonadota bacterium]|jgi:hypothetical protein|nr:MAG: hypothetical protein JSV95_04770 [Gemmatimonadota bacterium]
MRRTFLDRSLLEWEVYVSGGQPGTQASARIYFNCMTDRSRRPLFLAHEGGDVADAQRALGEMTTEDLLTMLDRAEPLP